MHLHHLGVVVNDLEETLEYYCEILGAKILWKEETPQQGSQTDTIYGFKGTKVLVAGIELYGVMIEFFQLLSPRPVNDQGRSLSYETLGWKHLAFSVENIEHEVERLAERGVKFLFPIQTLPHGVKIVYFVDPNGIMLELIQPHEE
ncbi:MAG: VOC family protein [Firmicutes bacterium]|mgnify:CR=1 FL=1|nr:VOC family protein [Bacillota bacterium]